MVDKIVLQSRDLSCRCSLGRVKKISCLSSEIFDEIRAGGRIFFLIFICSVCGLCEQSRGPLRNGRCCSVLYVAASVTGSTVLGLQPTRGLH